METILGIGYLFILSTIGLYLYNWSSIFKKIGSSTIYEINEGESEEDFANESEAKLVNKFGTITFLFIGIAIWTLLGIAVGKIASGMTEINVLRWFLYVLLYFVFLRLPFGAGNKMVKKSFNFERFPEKIIFSIFMILSYILSICCYEIIPQFLKWHLFFLN